MRPRPRSPAGPSYDDGGPEAARKYRPVASEQANFPVRTLCRVCGASRSAYYERAKKGDGPTEATAEEGQLANLVWDIYWASRRRYGSPRICAEPWRQDVKVDHKTVEALMAALGLQGLSGRRKLRTARQGPKATPAPGLVERGFSAEEPNQLYVGDITLTYIPTDEGYCFLASVLDVSSRLLAGWSLQAHMRTSLCTDALLAALGRRGSLAGSVLHTDHWCQYTSAEFGELCNRLGVAQSMGSVGDYQLTG